MRGLLCFLAFVEAEGGIDHFARRRRCGHKVLKKWMFPGKRSAMRLDLVCSGMVVVDVIAEEMGGNAPCGFGMWPA